MTRQQCKFLVTLTAAAMASHFAAQAREADTSLQQTSRYDLYQLAEHGDAAKVTEVIAEFRRRASTGDVLAASDLDAFLGKRAATGDDGAASELLGRAKAGDKNAQPGLFNFLETAAVKGSQAALAELRREADRGQINGRNAAGFESMFDQVLSERAVAGDTAALTELRGRVATGSFIEKENKRPVLERALEELAGLGNAAALAELRRAAENGDGSAEDSLGRIYYNGTSAIKRDFTMAARVQGCPVPDESIMAGCRSVEVSALPTPVTRVMKKLRCDDTYPEPVTMNLDDSGAPQYKLCCYEPPHGPCGAVVIGKVSGQWREISERGGISGYGDECAAFFPLTTIHGGFHDICLSGECLPGSVNGRPMCAKPIWEFRGGRYQRK